MTTPQEFVQEAQAKGFRVSVKGYKDFVVTVTKSFTPGDVNAYLDAERDANSLMYSVPMTYPGSVWGTDSGSVGGASGLSNGHMRLNKSGVGVRFGKGVLKALEVQ